MTLPRRLDVARSSAADTRKDDARVGVGAEAQDIHGAENDPVSPESPHVFKLPRGHASRRAGSRRLGPLECALLALIALGIAITVMMAIVNPSP